MSYQTQGTPSVLARAQEVKIHDEKWTSMMPGLKRIWRSYGSKLHAKIIKCDPFKDVSKQKFDACIDIVFDTLFMTDEENLKDYQIGHIHETISKIYQFLNNVDNIDARCCDNDDINNDILRVFDENIFPTDRVDETRVVDVSKYAIPSNVFYDASIDGRGFYFDIAFKRFERSCDRVNFEDNVICLKNHTTLIDVISNLDVFSETMYRSARTNSYRVYSTDSTVLDCVLNHYKTAIKQLYDCRCTYKTDLCKEYESCLNLLKNKLDYRIRTNSFEYPSLPGCACYSAFPCNYRMLELSIMEAISWCETFAKCCVGLNSPANVVTLTKSDFEKILRDAFEKNPNIRTLQYSSYYKDAFMKRFDETAVLNLKNVRDIYDVVRPKCKLCGSSFVKNDRGDGDAMHKSRKRKRDDVDVRSMDPDTLDVLETYLNTTERIKKDTRQKYNAFLQHLANASKYFRACCSHTRQMDRILSVLYDTIDYDFDLERDELFAPSENCTLHCERETSNDIGHGRCTVRALYFKMCRFLNDQNVDFANYDNVRGAILETESPICDPFSFKNADAFFEKIANVSDFFDRLSKKNTQNSNCSNLDDDDDDMFKRDDNSDIAIKTANKYLLWVLMVHFMYYVKTLLRLDDADVDKKSVYFKTYNETNDVNKLNNSHETIRLSFNSIAYENYLKSVITASNQIKPRVLSLSKALWTKLSTSFKTVLNVYDKINKEYTLVTKKKLKDRSVNRERSDLCGVRILKSIMDERRLREEMQRWSKRMRITYDDRFVQPDVANATLVRANDGDNDATLTRNNDDDDVVMREHVCANAINDDADKKRCDEIITDDDVLNITLRYEDIKNKLFLPRSTDALNPREIKEKSNESNDTAPICDEDHSRNGVNFKMTCGDKFLAHLPRWRLDMDFQMLVLRTYLFLKPIITRGNLLAEDKWTFDCTDIRDIENACAFMNSYGFFVVKATKLDSLDKSTNEDTSKNNGSVENIG